ncbi:hypothetical protein [Pseudanabaena sp. FACHB-2040]|uniref:hypothetical protein n=1 Tax=Pseudanabaena sp. FACHB-2040 TaxID=2692859 RepID=UPI0016852246|nr:hypothetical protein [Pseudanabaena sp. FACHB-2040]MBD2259032.1 hypothetical protein [Pseudanabaena sp. FACHB-2040]
MNSSAPDSLPSPKATASPPQTLTVGAVVMRLVAIALNRRALTITALAILWVLLSARSAK